MSKRTIGIVSALVAAATLVAIVLVTGASPKGTPVSTDTATRGTLKVTVSATGKTEADKKADVFAPYAGTIERVLVTEGQDVKAGAVLAELDESKLKAQVRRAQALYDAADAQYDAARAVPLVPSAAPGAGAQNRQIRAQRAAARAQREAAAVDLAQAKADRKASVLRAPMSGTVVFDVIGGSEGSGAQKPVAGASVNPQMALFTIVRLDSMRLRADLDENEVARVALGDKATVSIDAFPSQTLSSSVSAIQPESVATGADGIAFPITLKLPATEGLRIGMSGTAEITVRAIEGAITVPLKAAFEADEDTFVYVVENGRLAKRIVTTGAWTDTRIQITKGLAAGEEVAMGDESSLKDGMQVKTAK